MPSSERPSPPAAGSTTGLGIVMPALNAARTIATTLTRMPLATLAGIGLRTTVYVVDDGSTDGTAEAARGTELDCALTVLAHPRNLGYGAAQKTGLAASLRAGHALHAVLHADGQYAPEELPAMLAPLRDDRADVVIGSKFLRGGVVRQGMPLRNMLGIRVLDALEGRVFGTRGLEFHSGYLAYASRALERIPFQTLTDRFHFDGSMVLSAAKAGLRVTRVPIGTHYGADRSSLAPAPYLLEVLGVLTAYWRRRFWFQQDAARPPAGRDRV